MPIPLGVLAVAGAGAAGGGPAYELIQTFSLSGSSFTLSDIPQTYKHLQIRYVIKTDNNSTTDDINIRINGNTGSNYAFHNLRGTGSSVISTAVSPASFIGGQDGPMPVFGSGTGTTSMFASGVIDFLDYSSTSKTKVIRLLTGRTFTSNTRVSLSSGLFNSTSAATSMTFYSQNGANFASGSRLSLYGIR
jgi:hypothetical protein